MQKWDPKEEWDQAHYPSREAQGCTGRRGLEKWMQVGKGNRAEKEEMKLGTKPTGEMC